jgi:hypothetical protein
MRPGPLAFALAVPMLALGCHPEPTRSPAPTSPATADVTPHTEPAPLVRPTTLPPVPPEPPAPTAALPPGTPTQEGSISDLVAIDDDRAIVRFFVPGPDHAKQWWIALMRRDGSLAWVQTLAGDLASSEGSVGIAIVGDSVSLMTSTLHGDETELELHAFALADGARRFHAPMGKGFAQASVSDGSLRWDVRIHYGFARGAGVTAELVASSSKRVLWRAEIPQPSTPGPDPTLVGDAIAIRTQASRRGSGTTWLVFERKTGERIGQLGALPQSCSDGTRWFLLTPAGLVSVDPTTLRTRSVTGPLELPGLPGSWALDDCTIADGALLVLASRGQRKALVTLDVETFAVRGRVELGDAILGHTSFDPLPARLHASVAVQSMTHEGVREVLLADPLAGRPLERWRGVDDASFYIDIIPWRGGYLLPTRQTLSIVDGRTGILEGRAMIPEGTQVTAPQIAGDTLWLLPSAPLRLGARAPRLVDLHTTAAEDVRGAVLADLRPATTARAGGRPPCPDPTAPLVGSGKGTDGQLGPVARTRLPTWDLDILHETARSLACAPGTATSHLLAWHVMEDDRPLRNDNALLLVEDHATSPPRFTLVQVYRHANNREWNVNVSFHDPSEPIRTFDHRPSRTEIDDFLSQSDWHFGDDWGRVIAGNVLDAQWRAATHLPPWHAYPKGIEQPD